MVPPYYASNSRDALDSDPTLFCERYGYVIFVLSSPSTKTKCFSCRDLWETMILMFSEAFAEELASNPFSFVVQEVLIDLRRRQPPLLEDLQKLRLYPDDSFDCLDRAIDIWKTVGDNIGLFENGRHLDNEFPKLRLSRRRCHWEKCLCHSAKPSHSMRVCKGCYRVLYCSRKCQKR